MKIFKSNVQYQINLPDKELVLLNNALNEIRNGPDVIGDGEFQTRTGFATDEVFTTLAEIGEILDNAHG